MPSIEIICIGQIEPLVFDYASFAVRANTNLQSMRVPKSLFQSDFERVSGCIYHLLEADDQLTAWNLLKRDWYDENGDSNGLEDNLEFTEDVACYVYSMLEVLLRSSPSRKLLFTSDYQFGPKPAARFSPISLAEFWHIHDAGNLRMNSSYWIWAAI